MSFSAETLRISPWQTLIFSFCFRPSLSTSSEAISGRLLVMDLLLECSRLEEGDVYDVVEEGVRLRLVGADDDSPEEVAGPGVVYEYSQATDL